MSDESSTRGPSLWHRSLAAAVDHSASSDYHIPAIALMERAGHGVALEILRKTGASRSAPILILAGPGNNGGDALVAARYLAEAGHPVAIVLVRPSPETSLSPACALQVKIVQSLGHPVFEYTIGCLDTADGPLRAGPPLWIVDGLLGLGARTPLAEGSIMAQALAEAQKIAQKTAAQVLAVDLPSGLDPDDGRQRHAWLKADITVTFGGLKPAQVLAPARDLCGTVVALDIGFPKAAIQRASTLDPPRWTVPDREALLRADPWASLSPSAHKYDRGHVLILGGSPGKAGAPLLAAMAALRSGAGWATVSMPTDAMASLRGDVPREIVFESLFTKARDSHHTPASGDTVEAERLRTYLAKGRVNAVVVGPGCMASPLTRESMLVLQEFSSQGGGVLIDAGACHGIVPLASQVGCLSPDRWVLTPHPGEWVKMGLDRAATPETPQGVAEVYTMAKTLGLTLLYKNATPILISGSVKDAPSGSIALFGTRSLARAGSGDVLAGVTAAHLARGMAAEPATLRSQALIGHAADMAARELGEHAVLAQDIIVRLGRN